MGGVRGFFMDRVDKDIKLVGLFFLYSISLVLVRFRFGRAFLFSRIFYCGRVLGRG